MNRGVEEISTNLWSKLSAITNLPPPLPANPHLNDSMSSDTDEETNRKIKSLVAQCTKNGPFGGMTDVEMSELSDALGGPSTSAQRAGGFIDITDLYKQERNRQQLRESNAPESNIQKQDLSNDLSYLEIGSISSVMEDIIIIKGNNQKSGVADTGNVVFLYPEESVAADGEILEVFDSKELSRIGTICDIFGPVTQPNYVVLVDENLRLAIKEQKESLSERKVAIRSSSAKWACEDQGEGERSKDWDSGDDSDVSVEMSEEKNRRVPRSVATAKIRARRAKEASNETSIKRSQVEVPAVAVCDQSQDAGVEQIKAAVSLPSHVESPDSVDVSIGESRVTKWFTQLSEISDSSEGEEMQ
eukprot:GHVP01004911.1.p2 GENE.GHVP01004911.1~~GHVP01004911.1.p2  ORF type:complete len:403 (+),score=94.26 GHVP01004911.1:135-1211(+)